MKYVFGKIYFILLTIHLSTDYTVVRISSVLVKTNKTKSKFLEYPEIPAKEFLSFVF